MATRAQAMTVEFHAWDTSANAPKTGDAANITMRWVKDGTIAALTTGTVTELDATNAKGIYKVSLSSTETDCLLGKLCGQSTTANIAIFGPTIGFDQIPVTAAGAVGGLPLSVDTSGRVDVLKINGTSQTARDIGASVLLAAGQKVDVDTIKTNPVVNAGTVTFPTGATLASTTNITAGTIATVTTLTNAPSDSSGTTTLLARLTATRAGLLDNLDAAISTRSTYAGGDTAGTTTLLARLTATRAGYLDNLSGGAVALASGVIVTTNNDKTGYTAALSAADAAKLAAIWQIHGLDLSNPLTASATARAAGTMTQTISTLAGTTTVTRTA